MDTLKKPSNKPHVILSAAKNPVGLCREPQLRPSGFFTSFRMTKRHFSVAGLKTLQLVPAP
jgi:hypothetical protein